MGLLNLALGQLLGLFLPIAGFLVALYFYDRSRRRALVSTLRFWPRRPAPAVRQRHKRVQHPLSLLLQLIALLLLLLAIADPRPEALGASSKHVVIVLDTSAAMALSDNAGEPIMPQAQALALAYLERVPPGDRILLIEADGAPRVSVPFTTDRALLREALRAADPGRTALDLRAAFDLAVGTLRLALDAGGETLPERAEFGETVYIGPGRFAGQPVSPGFVPRLRYLETGSPSDSLGVLALRASSDHSDRGKWKVELRARNYETVPTSVPFEFFFDGRRLGHRELNIPAGQDASLSFTLRTRKAGRLEAKSTIQDDYVENNSASVRIPGTRRTQLQVVGASPESFAPLIAEGARLEPTFVDSVDELSDEAIHVWARGGDASASRRAILLSPPGTVSPAGDAGSIRERPIASWSASHPLAQGVRDQDFAPDRTRLFEPAAGDEIVAETDGGPVILARAGGGRRMVAFGFDLVGDSVRGRLAAPLLFANAVTWLDAAAFRPETIEARAPGTVTIEAPNSSLDDVVVSTAGGVAVPWLLSEGRVRFYAGQPGTYRVTTADRDVTLHLDQPRVARQTWDPSDALRGMPPASAATGVPLVAWPWLAALAGLLLLYDWIRYGRGRRLAAGALPSGEAEGRVS